jgi:hypothetical protein
MNNPPSYTLYPFQPSKDGAYNAPLPLITCTTHADAVAQAETFTECDIVVCYEGKQELIARRVNNAWLPMDIR